MGNQALPWQSDSAPPCVAAFPGKLRVLPVGTVEVPLPNTEELKSEHARDLARIISGGGLLFSARHSIRTVHAADAGAVTGKQEPNGGAESCSLLMNQIREELLHQGHSLRGGPCSRSLLSCLCQRRSLQKAWMNSERLQHLLFLISAHTSVGSLLHVVAELDLPPVVWQPLFALCMGAGQVRVLSFSFIGEPVVGDRPENKRTPFVLSLISDDLILAIRNRSVASLTFRQHFIGQRTADGARTTMEHLAAFEEQLFKAVDSGDWRGLAESQAVLRSIVADSEANGI